jgi:hypothetical protein
MTQAFERTAFPQRTQRKAKESKVRKTSWLRFLALFASFALFADKKAVRKIAAGSVRE